MSAAKKTKPKSAFPKGSKAACEAAGWKFVPLPSIGPNPFLPVGSPRATAGRYRHEGARGVEVIPPAGSGIEPRHFGGLGRAVAWAVEQLGRTAVLPPDRTPPGVDGIRLMLAAALVCGGPDETPERPDARLLSAARDVLGARALEDDHRASPACSRPAGELSSAIVRCAASARLLPELRATTREGLILKARAALAAVNCLQLVKREEVEILQSLALDLIALVPTLIDERGRSIVPPAPRTAEPA